MSKLMLNWLKKGTPSEKKLEAITSTPVLQLSQEHSSEHSKNLPLAILRWMQATSSNISSSLRILMENYFVSPAGNSLSCQSSSTSLSKVGLETIKGSKTNRLQGTPACPTTKNTQKKYETEVTSLTNTIAPEVNQWSRHLLCATHVVQSSEPSYCF